MNRKERIFVNLPQSAIEKDREERREWLQQTMKLGFMVEEGHIHQRIGDEYQRLRVSDFEPYPAPNESKRVKYTINFAKGLIDEIEGRNWSVQEWFNRVVTLRSISNNLSLHTPEEDGHREIILWDED